MYTPNENRNQGKDLLSILDQVKNGDLENNEMLTNNNDQINLFLEEDDEPCPRFTNIEQTIKVKNEAKIEKNSTNKKSKYEEVNNAKNDNVVKKEDFNLDIENDENIGGFTTMKMKEMADPEKDKPRVKMTILTNYQLENDRRYTVNAQNDNFNWREANDIDQDADKLPEIGTEKNMKKKKKNMKKDQNHESTPSILKDFMNDDIGEVGEWIEKTANVNAMEKDSNDEDMEDEDFEGLFDNNNNGAMKNKGRQQEFKLIITEENEGDDHLETKNEKENLEMIRANTQAKANLAASKVDSKKRKQFMMNNLKEKAKAISKNFGEEVETPYSEKSTVHISPTKMRDSKKIEDKTIANIDTNSSLSDSQTQHQQQNPNNIVKNIVIQSEEEEEKQPSSNNMIKNAELNPENDDDWNAISKFNADNISHSISQENFKLIDFIEAWETIKVLDLSQYKKQVHSDLNAGQSIFDKLFKTCSSSKLSASFLNERDQIFAYAKVQFDDKNPMHFDMLKTIYIKLTENYGVCPRYGSHWEAIGFQGKDPSTDLRGVGMLGLLQILAFLNCHHEFIKQMYQYSLDEVYNFPLSALLLGITKIMLEMLREGKLNGQINNQRSVINAVNNIYFAISFKIFMIYKSRKHDASNLGMFLKEIGAFAKSNPSGILQEFLEYLDSTKNVQQQI